MWLCISHCGPWFIKKQKSVWYSQATIEKLLSELFRQHVTVQSEIYSVSRGGPRGYWIVDLGVFKAWILDFEEKIDWILDFQKSVGFGFLMNFILDSGYWKKYHWILDFWTKIRWILDFVRFVGFSLDLDFSKNYSWILDFGQKKFGFLDSRTPRSPSPRSSRSHFLL